LTAEETARACGFGSIEALYTNRHRGLLPGRLGSRWRGRLWWRLSDIEAYLREQLSDTFDEQWADRHKHKVKPQPVTTLARQLADEKKAASA
jgi:hypothetical protein